MGNHTDDEWEFQNVRTVLKTKTLKGQMEF